MTRRWRSVAGSETGQTRPLGILTCALGLLFLSACTGSNQPARPPLETLLQDQHFPSPRTAFTLERPSAFLQLPSSYRDELDRLVLPVDSEFERYRALRRWVFGKFDNFDFEVGQTASLAELSNRRKINCLSFSAFFVAAARYSDLPADFQLVSAPPFWDSQNGSWINNQHINVTGVVMRESRLTARRDDLQRSSLSIIDGMPLSPSQQRRLSRYRYTADVNPAVVSVRQRSEIVGEQQVLALFYNNKSVESLLGGDLGAAYRYSRAALETDPFSAPAWTNLGVLYGRVQQEELALAAYRQALKIDAQAHSATSNLVGLYRQRGDETQALTLEARLAEFRDANPYYHAAIAEAALQEGRLGVAKRALGEAIERKHNEHYFYHLLARVNLGLGEEEAMLDNLKRARRYARGSERRRYGEKLDVLRPLVTVN